MAQTIPCDSNDGYPAVAIVTMIQDGDTVAWCADCFPVFCGTVVEAAGPDAPPADEPGDDTGATVPAGEGEPAVPVSEDKSRRGRPVAPVPAPEPDEPPVPAAAADDDR